MSLRILFMRKQKNYNYSLLFLRDFLKVIFVKTIMYLLNSILSSLIVLIHLT